MPVCIRARVGCRETENFSEWMFYFHLAVEVERAGGFEDAVELEQAVGHHGVLAEHLQVVAEVELVHAASLAIDFHR